LIGAVEDQEEVKGGELSYPTFAERQQRIYEDLNSYFGLLEALFTFGNTLELIYVGGMLHRPTVLKEREVGGPLPTLIPLFVEFKAKKCH
jgi:hypothetical protein